MMVHSGTLPGSRLQNQRCLAYSTVIVRTEFYIFQVLYNLSFLELEHDVII